MRPADRRRTGSGTAGAPASGPRRASPARALARRCRYRQPGAEPRLVDVEGDPHRGRLSGTPRCTPSGPDRCRVRGAGRQIEAVAGGQADVAVVGVEDDRPLGAEEHLVRAVVVSAVAVARGRSPRTRRMLAVLLERLERLCSVCGAGGLRRAQVRLRRKASLNQTSGRRCDRAPSAPLRANGPCCPCQGSRA